MKPIPTPTRLSEDVEFGAAIREAAGDLDGGRMVRNGERIRRRLAGERATTFSKARWFRFSFWIPLAAATAAAATGTYAIRSYVTPPALRVVHPTPDPTPTPVAVVTSEAMASPTPALRVKVPQSELDEQLRLFRSARDASGQRDDELALARLDELERRFPDTDLGSEAQLLRAESLAGLSRYAEAISILEPLSASPLLEGQRAEIFRRLGDLWLKDGDCERSSGAYRRSIALGLGEERAEAARKGLAVCAVPR